LSLRIVRSRPRHKEKSMTTISKNETGNDIKRIYVVGLVVAATLMVADVALMGLGLAIGL
jgi:uncharacterized membrane protein